MSFYASQYNSPQVDWWIQNAALMSSDAEDEYFSNLAAANSYHYPVQPQENHLPGGAQNQANTLNHGNLNFTNNYWQGNEFGSFVDPKSAYQQGIFQPAQLSSAYTPSASLPPTVFTKYPLAIDHYPTGPVAPLDCGNVGSFYTSDRVLPDADLPALDYDSTSPPDETMYDASKWTSSASSPPKKMESDSSQSAESQTVENLENADPCYAELLRQALMEAVDHTMLLKDLYEWVRTHSSKAQDPSNKGWQNSVRHNLSMNAAFERVPPANEAGTKKTSYWRLTEDAVERGISSTTRYRKDSKRKTQRNPNPAPLRVQSGAKGGQATRRSARRHQIAASSPMESQSMSPSSSMPLRQQHNTYPGLPHYSHPTVNVSSMPVSTQQPPSQQRTGFPNAAQTFDNNNTSEMFSHQNHISTSAPLPDSSKFEEHGYLTAAAAATVTPFGIAHSYPDWSLPASPTSHASHHDINWLSSTNQQNMSL